MFYLLAQLLYEEGGPFSFLRLFNYITFRAIFAAVTAFVTTMVIGGPTIRKLRELKLRNTVWQHNAADEEHKIGIPTMGGLIILIGFLVPVFFWCNLLNPYVLLVIGAALLFGLIGGLDDYLKLAKNNKEGLREKYKLAGQFGYGVLLAVVLCVPLWSPFPDHLTHAVVVPFYKWVIPAFFIQFTLVVLAVVGSSNAVNMADGLDGLAIVPTIFVAGVFAVFAYLESHAIFANYLNLPHLPGIGELSIACAALAGAGMGFLWFNCYPAQVFMGDLGSLSLGGILGVVAACSKQELLLVIAGGFFVLEAMSTLVQRYLFVDRLGRRFFFRAPFHHDLQFRGWSEPKVVVRLWIISAIFALLALGTIKIR